MHTHTQEQLYFPFMCLGAVKPFQQYTARHKCQETEATLRDLLLRLKLGKTLRLKLGKTWGSKKLVPVSARVGWMTGTLEGTTSRGPRFAFHAVLCYCFS